MGTGPRADLIWPRVLFSFLAIAGIGGVLSRQADFSTFFLTTAVVYAGSFFLPIKKLSHGLVILVAGWILCLLALGDLPHYGYAFEIFGGLSLPNPVFHFAVGFGLLLGFWRFLPPIQPLGEMALSGGRVWFWGIFLAALFLRFQHIGEAPGAYWDDPGVCIIDPQGILNFHEYVMLFPLGQREPFFSYFMAGLWALDPHAHAILIQRLGGAILDLAAVVVFYFAGKEAGGVMTGLVAEAAAAFSKPLLIENLIGMTAVTVPLAVGLLLLTTLRLFKKQDGVRFFLWALAMGFAPYNYTPVRTWLPFIVTAVFLWIWFFRLKDRPKTLPEYWLGWGTLLIWNILFLKVNNFLPETLLALTPPQRVFAAAGLAVPFGFCTWNVWRRRDLTAKNLLPFFFMGVAVSAALIYPLASEPDIAVHTSGLSIFHNQETRTFHYENTIPAVMVKKTLASLQTMFYGGQDRGDLNLPWDAFFEFHFAPLFVIGFVAFLSRPIWLSFFLVLAGFVGISAHILSIDPHSAKLVAAVAPMAVLSGLGIQQFLAGLFRENVRLKPVVTVVCLLYLGWAFWGTYDRVWGHYFKTDGVDKIVSRTVAQLDGPCRVYFAPFQDFASPETQTLLDEGRDVFLLRASNPIFLRPGEKPKDLAVLLQVSDLKNRDRILKEFPHADWSIVKSNREGNPEVERIARIPAADIPNVPGKLFYSQNITDADWVREFSSGSYLLYSGLIAEEDVVKIPSAPIPPDMGGDIVLILGSWVAPETGTLKLKVTSANYAILDLDGKTVLDFRPWNVEKNAEKSIEISRGKHQVAYRVYLHMGNQIPQIKISVNGGAEEELGAPVPILGDSSQPMGSGFSSLGSASR